MAERKAIFLTGASGGIGRASIARLRSPERVIFAGVRDVQDLADFADARDVVPIEVDLTQLESVADAAEQVARRLGQDRLEAVVNNAGVIVQGPLELIPAEELERQFRVNVFGPAAVVRAFGPRMRRDRTRLINVSAPTARRALPHLGAISASKAALESLSAALRVELAEWGCEVVIVEPTATATKVFQTASGAADAALATMPPAVVQSYRSQLDAVASATASQRLADPDAIARVIAHAVSVRRPRTVYYAGTGARTLPVLASLPDRLGDRLVARSLGLSAAVARQSG